MKDIPFYEEAREVDVKTLQERLEQREKKRQEGKLRKFPDEKGHGSSSTARPPAKKKKDYYKNDQGCDPAPESPSTSTASMSSRTTNSAQTSQGDFSSLSLDPRDPGTHASKPEPESIALEVINESEEEEDMNDLRA